MTHDIKLWLDCGTFRVYWKGIESQVIYMSLAAFIVEHVLGTSIARIHDFGNDWFRVSDTPGEGVPITLGADNPDPEKGRINDIFYYVYISQEGEKIGISICSLALYSLFNRIPATLWFERQPGH